MVEKGKITPKRVYQKTLRYRSVEYPTFDKRALDKQCSTDAQGTVSVPTGHINPIDNRNMIAGEEPGTSSQEGEGVVPMRLDAVQATVHNNYNSKIPDVAGDGIRVDTTPSEDEMYRNPSSDSGDSSLSESESSQSEVESQASDYSDDEVSEEGRATFSCSSSDEDVAQATLTVTQSPQHSLRDMLKQDPEVQKIESEMAKQCYRHKRKECKRKALLKEQKKRKQRTKGRANELSKEFKTPSSKSMVRSNRTKLPSDTTLYKPALAMGRNNSRSDIINRISNFVEGIRIESEAGDLSSWYKSPKCSTEMDQHARKKSDDKATRAIIQAEQFKAQLTPPPGAIQSIQSVVDNDNDDDFFHVSCHIDDALKEKIERGEFVDLEHLLPKERANYRLGEERCLELVSKDGLAYFTPSQDRKISGLRKWEQAFRV